MPSNFVPILFDHETLTLLHRLLERAQEAGLVQAEEQDAASFLRTLIRDGLLDLDTLRQDEDLDVDPASVPPMPGAEEVTPGVYLVPSESDYMARGLECPDVWTPGTEGEVD